MILTEQNIVPFWGAKGKYGIYSQWYKAPFIKNNISYCCNEQYMMYQKAVLFQDYETAETILNTDDPKTIKALGRKVKSFNQMIWDHYKRQIVFEANYEKFTQNAELKAALIETGDKIIIEASPLDKIWGVGLDSQDERLLNTESWRGQNLLGEAIMQVRDLLKADE